MKNDRIDPTLEKVFDSLRQVPPADGKRQLAGREALLAQARRQRALTASAGQTERPRSGAVLPLISYHTRRLAIVGVLVAVVLALLAGTGGVIYAADGAVPGEPLYSVDQAVESARLSLTREPQATVKLLLSFADERLLEAEELSGKGDGKHLQVALIGYGDTVSSLAQTIGAREGSTGADLAVLVDQSVSAHEAQLTTLLEGEVGDDRGGDSCVGTDPHPVATSLAESYGVPYEEIMDWFCNGNYGFGEIMHALQTSDRTGTPASELLALKTELGGWGQVWHELGLKGQPDDAGPPEGVPAGPPEHAGPPEGVPAGPPDHAGPPEGVPAGPPDHAGPSDGTPAGPPDYAGPPDGVPAGPPDHAGPPDNATPGPPGKVKPDKKAPAGPPDKAPTKTPKPKLHRQP